MSFPDKALWIIERNSTQPLTLDGIAAACGVSRSHLAHAFGTATGLSVMQYVRARRLTAAARALAAGAPDILAIALEAGYGSHEAFTRAFRDRFQQTPESVRERRSVDGLALVGPLELRPHGNVRLDPPRVVDEQIVRVVGLAERCSFDTTITIPAQWQRFMECFDAIPDKRDRIPVGVNYSADDDGQFQYMCGAEVYRFGEHSRPLLHLEIQPRHTRCSSTAATSPRSSRPTAAYGTRRCRPLAAPWPMLQSSSDTIQPSTHALERVD